MKNPEHTSSNERNWLPAIRESLGRAARWLVDNKGKGMSEKTADREAVQAAYATIDGITIIVDEQGNLTDEGIKEYKRLRRTIKPKIGYKNAPKPAYVSLRGQLVPRVTRIINPGEE